MDENTTEKMEAGEPMISEKELNHYETEKLKQFVAAIVVSFGAVCAGTVLAWTSPVLPQLQISAENNQTKSQNGTTDLANVIVENVTAIADALISSTTSMPTVDPNPNPSTLQFTITENEGSWVGSFLPIGALIAAIPAGFCAEKYGRRFTLLTLTIPFLLNWILICMASSATLLYVARFFSGIATGSVCVLAPMYIGEIAESSVRGALGSFFQMFLCVGILITFFIGAYVDWLQLSKIMAAVPILFGVAFYFMPETPVYLLKTGDRKEATRVLKYFRGSDYDPTDELKTIQADIDAAADKTVTVSDMIKNKGNKKALITSLGLMFFQQFSGINAVIFYTVPIFKSAGSSMDASTASIIVAVVQVIFAYVAVMLVEKAGRRFFLLISAGGMMVCLILLGGYYHMKAMGADFCGMGLLPLVSLVVFIIAFCLGMGPIPWMIMGELFASEVKGIASGMAVTTNWILVFIVTKNFPTMNASLGPHITFYIFAMFMAGCLYFVKNIVPETRGKTLQEIQTILNT